MVDSGVTHTSSNNAVMVKNIVQSAFQQHCLVCNFTLPVMNTFGSKPVLPNCFFPLYCKMYKVLNKYFIHKIVNSIHASLAYNVYLIIHVKSCMDHLYFAALLVLQDGENGSDLEKET